MVDSNQVRLWVFGSLFTTAAIVVACIVGIYLSELRTDAILGFGAIIIGIVFQTTRQEIAAIRADHNAKIAAVKVEAATAMIQENHVNTEQKLAAISGVTLDTNRTTEKVHVLVNSNMAKALKSVAIALRTVATLRPSPETEKAAVAAEGDYLEHERKQQVVDSGHIPPVSTTTILPDGLPEPAPGVQNVILKGTIGEVK